MVAAPVSAVGIPRARPRGVATSDLVTSVTVGTNADLFPDALSLHVPLGSTVADVTYGCGVFWRNVPADAYRLLPSDLKTGTDCRSLPYKDGSLDAVVLDPPYMEGFYRETSRAGSGSHSALSSRYSSGREGASDPSAPKHQAAVLAFYLDAAREAARVLRPGGTLLVKCQDAVSAGKQHLTHVDIINEARTLGLVPRDLFVLVRTNAPASSRILRQVHARKAHSYLLVFAKAKR